MIVRLLNIHHAEGGRLSVNLILDIMADSFQRGCWRGKLLHGWDWCSHVSFL